ncbi:A nuclease family of the HNH/ENDO VII superfamily with conserved AHH [Stigmatella aurantiaca]|uniref:A nuclease family of the HNH/ENDO VII superfamily with conserved AHH n=1 Tax=Stigmatella aurantiaca TaxID=41 RepID=A0A1H7NM71_STIAU|nr:AHH domain-containing protein [Stigmatella aurantiaca]SEL24419.1 A nuclease family of the HNH/ENDO VII superfamily with conserved AHH [Stigmatella aurantiaca]
MLWRILWKAEALLLAVLVGCSATQPAIRVDTESGGETLIYIPRASTVEPVQVAREQVTEAIRKLAREVRLSGSPRQTVERLFQLDALYGDYLLLLRERKIVPLESSGMPLEGALTEEEQNLVSRYKAWCRSAHGFEGDCLGALVGGKYLDRLKDPENIVPIKGHKGPHPQRYHDIVYTRLREALGDCGRIGECRARLTDALKKLANETATPGTELNRLVTLGK